MNECMNLGHKFPPLRSPQSLHEAGPPNTKDTPHCRFDSERVGFPECHCLRALCYLVICNVKRPLLAVGSQNLPVMALFSSLVSIWLLMTLGQFLLENYKYIFTLFLLSHHRNGKRPLLFPLPFKASWMVFLGTLMLERPVHMAAGMSSRKTKI